MPKITKIENAKPHAKLFFFLIFAVVAYFSFIVLKPVLTSIILAGVTVVLFAPLYDKFFKWFKQKKTVTILFLIFLITVIVIAPLSFMLNLLIKEGIQLVQDISLFVNGNSVQLSNTVASVNDFLTKIPWYENSLSEENIVNSLNKVIGPVGDFLINLVTSFSKSALNLIPNIVIFYYLIAVFFAEKQKISKFIKRLSPLDDKLDSLYIKRVGLMTKSLVAGTFLIAFLQSGLGLIALKIVGAPYLVFWFALMFIAAFIPLGTGLVLVPAAIVLLLLGNWVGALFVFLFYVLVVSNADNLLRVYLTPKETQIHPLLNLLAIMGGLKIFGFLGFIYGPIVMIFLITTIEIYLDYYQSKPKV
jgi:predicted PurR-regulated permease PerM